MEVASKPHLYIDLSFLWYRITVGILKLGLPLFFGLFCCCMSFFFSRERKRKGVYVCYLPVFNIDYLFTFCIFNKHITSSRICCSKIYMYFWYLIFFYQKQCRGKKGGGGVPIPTTYWNASLFIGDSLFIGAIFFFSREKKRKRKEKSDKKSSAWNVAFWLS